VLFCKLAPGKIQQCEDQHSIFYGKDIHRIASVYRSISPDQFIPAFSEAHSIGILNSMQSRPCIEQ
jgi:hypothetical protein